QRQEGHVGAAALDGIQQGLILQIADENVLFVVRQVLIVDPVLGNVHFLRTPEEGQLLFNQLFKNRIFLLVVASHVNRLPKEHGFFELVVIRFRKSTIGSHDALYPCLDLARAACATVVLYFAMRIIGTVAGVVVVQGLHTVFVGQQQVLEQLLHRYATTLEPLWVIVGVRRDRLVNELLHHANQLQVVVVTRHLPQQLVLILIFFKFRHHLTQDAVLGLLDGHQATRRLNTIGGIGNLAGGFRRHQGGQGGVAQTVLDDVSTQGFPIQVQRLVANTVYIFLVGVGRQQSLGIGCFVKGVARTVFT